MADYIGPYEFAQLDQAPRQVDRQFRAVSHGGQDGVTIWDDGLRADQYTMRGITYTLNYAMARYWYEQLKQLESSGPVAITQGSLVATDRVYQVVRVVPVECKQIVFGRGPLGLYHGKLVVDVTVQPIAI